MGDGEAVEAIFFDLTQLAFCAAVPTASGIGRVEVAYARYLIERFPDQVRFLVALPSQVQVVPTRVAAKFINATAAAWASGARMDSAVVDKVAKFLGVPLQMLDDRVDDPHGGTSFRVQRILSSAEVLMHSTLQHLRPRSLVKYRKSEHRSIYINVSGSGVDARWICRWLQKSPSVSGLFLLHDIIPITHPEFVHPRAPLRHVRYVRQLAQAASAILTNSNYTAECLIRYAKESGLHIPAVVTAPLGVESVFEKPVPRTESLPPYFVFLGTIEPRKNHLIILQVWRRLVEKHGDSAPKLLLIGRRGRQNKSISDVIKRATSLKGHVLECNGLSDKVVARLVANARAALLPSHVEGYGLPIAEALSLGTPLICSDLAPFREIAGGVPEYVDPLAGRGWRRIVMEYCEPNGPRPSAQRQRLRHFQQPTWARHFGILEQTLATLEAERPSQYAQGLQPTAIPVRESKPVAAPTVAG